MSELIDLTAAQAAARIRAGEIDARELFDAYRARAATDREAGERGLNCFTWVSDEQAEVSDGVPIAVKDLFCTQGVPSQSGSRILEGYLPPYTATAVQRLQEAGAPLLAPRVAWQPPQDHSGPALQPYVRPWAACGQHVRMVSARSEAAVSSATGRPATTLVQATV